MKTLTITLISLFLLIACQTTARSTRPDLLPMVDGQCRYYQKIIATLEHKVTVHFAESQQYVWLCFELPEESFGLGEFIISTEQLPRPLVLHVSAQLGEWIQGDDDSKPTTPNSPLWWKIDGWIANPGKFNGMEKFEGKEEPKFLRSEAREFQFEKSRFGSGSWEISGDLWSIKTSSGEFATVSITTPNRQTLQFDVR